MGVSTLAVFIVSLWALAIFAVSGLQHDMERISGIQQFSTATMVANDLNREIQERFNALKIVASDLTPALMNDIPALQKTLEQRPVFQAMFNAGTFVTGQDGIATASIPESAKRLGVSYHDRDYMITALSSGIASVSKPGTDKGLQANVFTMVVPILNTQGKITGALTGVTNLGAASFLDYVTDNTYGETGGFFIVEPKQGRIVTANDKARIMEILGKSRMTSRYANGYEGSDVYVNQVGVEVLASVKHIPAAQWYLVVSLPVAEAFAPINQMRQRVLWVTIWISIIACGIAWWMLRRQLFPLLSTTEALAAMVQTTVPLIPLAIPKQQEAREVVSAINQVLHTLSLREAALRESKIFGNAILDSVFSEIAVLDRHGVITAVNQPWRHFAEANSLHPDTPALHTGIGINYLDICSASSALANDDAAFQVQQGIAAVLDRRLPLFSLEYRCDTPDEQRWFMMIVTPLELADGGAVIAHNDITQRKQVEESLRISEQRFAMMQRGANDGYWDIDLLTGHTFYSARWWEMLGYYPDELVGNRNLWHGLAHGLWHPEDLDRVSDFIVAALADATSSYSIQFRLRHKDGHYVAIDSRGYISRDAVGKAIRVSGSNLDLTDRQRVELRLSTALAEAETANEAKISFLAAVSHDLRQPLAALTLYVDMLDSAALGHNAKILPRIKDCVSNLGELLGNLLNVSKLQAGAIVPVLTSFPMNEVIATLQSIHSAQALKKGLRIRIRPSNLVVHSDHALMLRLLGNLVANAVQYTEDGGVLIACRLHEGKQWIEVIDTGIGIAEDKVDFIFGEFRQIDNEARNAGSGLGLYIVAKTAELLGLQIRVRSRLRRGSLFALELPVEHATIEEEESLTRRWSGKLQVALIEDNLNVLHALTASLEHLGYEVIAAESGYQIIENLCGKVPDLIISDYRLAFGETGYDVIADIRAIFDKHIPALIITGDTEKELISSMSERGIVVMYKPTKIEELQESILQIIHHHESE